MTPLKLLNLAQNLIEKIELITRGSKSKAQQYGGEFILLNKKDEAVTIDYLVAKPLTQNDNEVGFIYVAISMK